MQYTKGYSRILCMLLTLLVLLSLLPVSVLAADSGNELSEGAYTVPVNLMKASDITSSSMAAAALGETATVVVNGDGSYTVTIDGSGTVMGVATSSDWKAYEDSELTKAIETADNGNGTYTYTLRERAAGTYVTMYVAAMNTTMSAYVAYDWDNAELVSGGEEGVTVVNSWDSNFAIYYKGESGRFESNFADAVTVTEYSNGSYTLTLTANAINGADFADAEQPDGVTYVDNEDGTRTYTFALDSADGLYEQHQFVFAYYIVAADRTNTHEFYLELVKADDGEEDDNQQTTTYEGSAVVDGYGYTVNVKVAVDNNGIITAVEITSDDVESANAYSQSCYEKAVAALTASLVGVSATKEGVTGVDAVSGATMSRDAIVDAVVAALGYELNRQEVVALEADKTYQVKVTYKAAAHSLVSNPTATADEGTDSVQATITVGGDGVATITLDLNNTSEMYIIGFNGTYTDGSNSEDLVQEGVAFETEELDGYTCISRVSFPITPGYEEYYSNVTVFVPAMAGLSWAANGFSSDATLTVDWSTLEEVPTTTDPEEGDKPENGVYTVAFAITPMSDTMYFAATVTVADGAAILKVDFTTIYTDKELTAAYDENAGSMSILDVVGYYVDGILYDNVDVAHTVDGQAAALTMILPTYTTTDGVFDNGQKYSLRMEFCVPAMSALAWTGPNGEFEYDVDAVLYVLGAEPIGDEEQQPDTTRYYITVVDAEYGAVTADANSATAGTTVTLTATPDSGYALSSLTVMTSAGDEVALTQISDTAYTFTMPGANVTVTPVFVASGSSDGDDGISASGGENNGDNATAMLWACVMMMALAGTVVTAVITRRRVR